MRTHHLLLAALTLGTLSAGPATAPSSRPSAPPGWKLVWGDEFDTPGAPDPHKWRYETGMVRNAEAQSYTDRRENARVEDGHLVIEARHEDFTGADGKSAHYTSASLESDTNWTYGRIEVRAQLPKGRGSWPAIWTLGTNIGQVGWPACGELDIMEEVGYDPGHVHATTHTLAYNHVKHTAKSHDIHVPDAEEAFHVYAAEWTPEKIDVFLDGRKYYTFDNEHTGNAAWPFDKPQYLKLNLAIGGAWGGQKGVDDATFPQRYLIDYVRVYQKE